MTRAIPIVLVGLVLLDGVLSVWGFAFRELWFQVFHGAEYVDPAGFLPRCAANWTGFFVLQVLALAMWRRAPWWLLIVAGCRLGDALTDVTCLWACEQATAAAWVLFPVAGIGNLVVGVFLIRGFLSLDRGPVTP